MSLSAIPGALRRRVFDRDGGRCRYCRLAQVGQAAVFHINHVVPRSKGGTTAEDNLVLQCPYCSLHKSNQTEALDAVSGAKAALYHPLRQEWSEHFAIGAAATVLGLTPIGRVTVEALRMNDALPTVARALQIRMGLLRV